MAAQSNSILSKLSDTGRMVANFSVDLRGRKVKDKDGQPVGVVTDLLIDEGEQKVRFLVVAHGGFLGFGDTTSFVPVEAITKITREDVDINHSQEHVAGAPKYDPSLVDVPPYYDGIYGYYGYPPNWGGGGII